MTMNKLLKASIVALLATTALAGSALARDLVIGRVAEQSSIDPHFNNAGNDTPTRKFIYDSLVDFDAKQNMYGTLALSWETVDPLTWIVHLRPNVKFHNGDVLTAEDVKFSIDRVPTVPNSPSSWERLRGDISVEVVDDLTVKVTSATPSPLLIEQFGQIPIISKSAAENAETSDFNDGVAAIGTGPYKYVSWTRRDNVKFSRFDDYWGGKPEWDNVTMRFIPNAAARVAALLSGDVDVIDAVPIQDIPRIENDPNLRVWSTPTVRITYLVMDQGRDVTPFLTDTNGKPLTENPLRDQRVRSALSKLIDRETLVARVAGGGSPAGQLIPKGQCGYNDSIEPTALDVDGAKALLAEAGYPDGFGLTIHASNDRFPQDAAVAQAIAQMWARGGIKINDVVTLPFATFTANATKQEYSVYQYAYNGSAPGATEALRAMLGTYDLSRGMGGVNRGRYSNADIDAKLEQASEEFDEATSCQLLEDAMKIGMDDVGVIPTYMQQSNWATKADVVFEPAVGDETAIRFIHPAE